MVLHGSAAPSRSAPVLLPEPSHLPTTSGWTKAGMGPSGVSTLSSGQAAPTGRLAGSMGASARPALLPLPASRLAPALLPLHPPALLPLLEPLPAPPPVLLPLLLVPSSKSESAAIKDSGLGDVTARPAPVVKAGGLASRTAFSGTAGRAAGAEASRARRAERRRLLGSPAAALPGMVVK